MKAPEDLNGTLKDLPSSKSRSKIKRGREGGDDNFDLANVDSVANFNQYHQV